MGSLEGKVACITGGTRSIGRGIADALLAAGACVVVNGRDEEKGKRCLDEMDAGDRAAFYAGWTDRIGERLLEARDRAQLSAGAATEEVDPTTGDVSLAKVPALLAKDVEVEDYYGAMLRQHGVRGTWRGGSQVTDGRSALRGMAAADRARLGGEKELSA